MQWRRDRRRAKEYGLIEKSRDAGLTWLNCCANVHSWLFEPSFKGSIGSRKQDLVDRLGDPDSIFEKMRMILKYLPPWMLPAEDDYSTNHLKFINRANGATITGEAGDNMGRGGRSTTYDIDEAAFIERPMLVDAAVSENTNVVFYTSTPNGSGNAFAEKRHGGKIHVFTFHWLSDPRKNKWELRSPEGKILKIGRGEGAPIGAVYPWYEDKKKKLDPVVLAQEIDIDYTASIAGICIPAKWVRAAVGLSLSTAGHRTAGLDVAEEGRDSNVWVDRVGPVVQNVEQWGYGNTTQTAFKAIELGKKRAIAHLSYDGTGVGAGVGGTMHSSENLPFTLDRVMGSASPSNEPWEDFNAAGGQEVPTAKDIFANRRAELWWKVRRRFEKTYERVTQGIAYDDAELISIPQDEELISQLSQLRRIYNNAGKILIESKASTGKSPDKADALVYAFVDPPEVVYSAPPIYGGKPRERVKF